LYSDVTESESELGPKPAPKRRASARPALKQTRSTRSAASRTSTRGKDRSIPDDEIEFTASEESEAYAEFAGDDSELDSDPELPAKGRKTPSKPARKSTAGTTKEKGKKLGGKKVQAIKDEELNTEDEMLQAAIAVSPVCYSREWTDQSHQLINPGPGLTGGCRESWTEQT
jgi:hypothetical protein